jgi:hypothetical protein
MTSKGIIQRIIAVALFAVAWPFAAVAQGSRVVLDFPDLAAKAAESVDVTLDGPMLRLAGKFLSGSDSDERAVREMINGLQGIYVRSYTFDQEGAYDHRLADKIRAQLGPTWQKIVKVQSKREENVDIFVDTRGDAIAGLVIIAAEPKEFTVVNIVGPVDLDKLASLEGQFGIPRLSGDRQKDRDKDKAKDKAKDKDKVKGERHD